MAGIISINANGLSRYGRALRDADPEVVAQLGAGLRVVAEEAAVDARHLASWSTRIPATVKAGGTGRRSYVKAGGTKAPHAPAFENHGKTGSFRHPVFGNDVWVDQDARPFLSPAVDHKVDAEKIAFAITRRIEEL